MSSTGFLLLKLENVLYEKKGSIAYVTINRPKVLNALNAKKRFPNCDSAFEDARDDSEVRGVVFHRSGRQVVCGPAPTSAKWPTTLPSRRKQKNTGQGNPLRISLKNLGKAGHRCREWFRALVAACELSMASTIRIRC